MALLPFFFLLLGLRHETRILRAVVARVHHSSYRVARFSQSTVREKIYETVFSAPSVTHHNVCIGWIFLVSAALVHRLERIISRRLSSAWVMAVLDSPYGIDLF